MRRTGLAVVLAFAALAAPAQGADVFVSDTTIAPTLVTIPSGSFVEWRSTGTSAHTIASNGRPTFRTVALPAGGKVKRTFGRPGRYRYRMDGRIAGTVLVLARAAPAPKPRPGTRCRPRRRCRPGESGDPNATVRCNTRKVYRYTISAEGRYEHSVTTTGLFAGSEQAKYNFFSAHARVPVWVERPCFVNATTLATVRSARAGTIHVNISLNNDQDDHPLNPADNDPEFRPCSFQVALSLPTPALALLGIVNGRNWTFGVGLAPIEDLEARAVFEYLNELQKGACGTSKGSYWTDFPGDPHKLGDLEVNGPVYANFGAIAPPKDGTGTPPEVLRDLLAGRNSRIDTGKVEWQYAGNRSNSTPTTGTWSIKFVFQRVR